MKKHIYTVSLIVALSFVANAGEPVTPPSGLEEEQWEMTYDLYKAITTSKTDNDKNRIQPVIVSRSGEEIYIKGVFPSCPDSWIKGYVKDGKCILDNAQVIGYDDNEPLYFVCGKAEPYIESGNTFRESGVDFYWKENIEFTVSDNGESLTYSGIPSNNSIPSFWNSRNPQRPQKFFSSYQSSYGNIEEEWTGYPNVEYFINMSFHKIDSGCDNIAADDRQTDKYIYDLQGRRVNPDNLHPGIYLRGGKKIVVK